MNKITFFTICLLFLIPFDTCKAQAIVINEILSSNANSVTDEDGSHQDWIELYNPGPASVSLLGYGLTDDAALPYKWVFPAVSLNSGAYLIVWASDKNRAVAGNPLHTNFKIGTAGETLTLTNASGTTVDTFPPANLPSDVSYGRSPNGSATFAFFGTPTPNAANTTTAYSEVLNPPAFSHNSGFRTTGFSLTLSSLDPGTTIYYTLDGSEPDENNLSGTTYSYKKSYPELPGQPFGPFFQNSFQTLQYSGPIAITDRSPLPNKLANISTTFDFAPDYFPDGPVFKGTVVRAKAVKAGALSSKTVTKNYFITPLGANRFTIPVISLSFDENDFYDYTDGISVAGVDFDNWRMAHPTEEVNENLGNFNRSGEAYEREANLNYFVNGNEVVNQKVGLRIHGDYSRLYPSKSMRVYARSSYGADKLEFPFFADEPYTSYERFVIKNSGSDFANTMFRDALCNELVKDLRMETEASQQVITFINGEYWGILALRERYDNNYFKQVYNIDAVDLLENEGEVKEGDAADYLNFFSYFENNDLSDPANYAYIQTRMDVDNFMDYFISNIYLQNDDWLDNNVVYWRKKTSGYQPNAATGHDGRWRWAYHDVTSTFGEADYNTLSDATTTDENIKPLWSTLLLRKLLTNDTFRVNFINRFADLMNTNFLPARIISQIDQMAAVIAPEMNDQYFRWKAPEDNGDWQYHLNEEKDFANQRPAFQQLHIRNQFGIPGNINVTLDVSDAAHGYIKMNTINILDGTPGITGNPYPWTGVYFHNIPVTVKAIPISGYQFSHWSGASNSTDAEITLTPTTDFSLTAHFTPLGSGETPEVVYFWMMDTNIANDTPLTSINSTFEASQNGVLEYQSCLPGYPFTSTDPNWRKASMERRNSPTVLNYIPQANGGLDFASSNMRGLQIKQPFQNGSNENALIFNFSTAGFQDLKFAFAVKDEGAATGITIEYATNQGSPAWTTTGLPAAAFPITGNYQRLEVDFSGIPAVNNNPDFKVRLRFTGPNMTADNGDRVTFNNFSVEGKVVTLSTPENATQNFLVYPNPATTLLNIVHSFDVLEYQLYSVEGKKVEKGQIKDKQIDVSHLPSGIYLLHLAAEGKKEVKKFIKF
ncbi:CotH kinase family protein [Flavobacterium suncheonense]|uniref:CotH kinase family protein n=1 Tax=Flavobacterium suncheonense TaxID=350894 RepID=UPI00041454FF|nr:CotH kinase family protein [Flavobacterium suncheonense]